MFFSISLQMRYKTGYAWTVLWEYRGGTVR